MNRYLLSLLFIFSLLVSSAQNYYVVKVEGKISLNKLLLKTGDKLTKDDKIKFSNEKDKIYLLSPGKGYFLLSPTNQGKKKKEWVVSLQKAIIPQNKYYNTANRGSITSFAYFDDVYDLMGFFRDDILIIDEGKFVVNPDKLPMDSNNYLEFISLDDKKINYTNDSNSFLISGNFSIGKFQLNYFSDDKINKIGTFNLRILQRSQIAEELAVFFKNQNPDTSTSNYYEQVIPYIKQAYGNTNLEIIKSIISEDLDIALAVKD